MKKELSSFLLLAAILSNMATAGSAEPGLRTKELVQHIQEAHEQAACLQGEKKLRIAGLNVVVWEPDILKSAFPVRQPLVIFSHGFRGYNAQTRFLMKAFADAGYLVIAPNHKDAIKYGLAKRQLSFSKISSWSADTYKDREEDIRRLVNALHMDPTWNSRIDWTKLALAGHSLGGYTVLGLAGAWPSWKLPGVRAVIALSPYTNPFIMRHTLDNIDVPVMYQSGTRDSWIKPFVKNENGAFGKTPSPAVYVEFKHANHFAWSNFNRDSRQKDLISHYCVQFLNKYVLAEINARPEEKLAGVTALQAK